MGEQGQILVLFALSIVLVLAMAGVAIDAGRFMTQQRFLQNAADAAALAAADAAIQQPSATVASVDQAARDNLAINLAGSTVGGRLSSRAWMPRSSIRPRPASVRTWSAASR